VDHYQGTKKRKSDSITNSALRAVDLRNYIPIDEFPVPTENNTLRRVHFKEALDTLSDSAKQVVNIVFDTPMELSKAILSSKDQVFTLTKIKDYLINHLGWSIYVTQKSINEIRKLLRSTKW